MTRSEFFGKCLRWACRSLGLALFFTPLGGTFAASPLKAYTGDNATFVTSTLDGTPYDLADHRGEAVLVNFWATWCPPCVEELPSMQQLAELLEEEPFALIIINMGEEPRVVASFVDKLDLDLTVLIDTDGTVTRDWGVFAYPSTFLVDPDGKITHVSYGEADWTDPKIVSIIEATLP